MTLPHDIEKQISDREHELTMPMLLNSDHEIGYCHGFSEGYIKGATEWVEKALEREKVLVEALGEIVKWEFATDGRKFNGDHKDVLKQVLSLASEGLASYKEKEGEGGN